MLGKFFRQLGSSSMSSKATKIIANVTGNYPSIDEVRALSDRACDGAAIGIYANEFDLAFSHIHSFYLTESWVTGEIRSSEELQRRIFDQFDRCMEAGLIKNSYTITEFAKAKQKLLGV